jgi:hypothetical protein
VYAGSKVTPDAGSPDRVRVEAIALLPGRRLMGTAGPGNRWMSTLTAPSQELALNAGRRVVDLVAVAAIGPLELAATASLLQPLTPDFSLNPTFHGAAPDPDRPTAFIVGREAMDATVEGPSGTRIWWAIGGRQAGGATVSPDGLARIRLLDAGDGTEGDATVFSIAAVTPVGHAYQGAWRLRVLRQPPSLGISDEVPFLDMAPVVAGQTVAGSSMTLNGEPAQVAADGSFSVPVDVGIVPTEIRIVVTDPVGNQTERLITRVWPLDYRQLPWAPIAVFVLFTVAGLLYVYEPEARPRRGSPQDEESTFEEIGG